MRTPRTYYGLALVLALATAAFLLLAIGALGIVGDGGRADRVFLAVPAVLVVGSLIARLRPRGMALTLTATAVVQAAAALVAVVAVMAEVRDFAGASIADIVMVNAMYLLLFAASAWLFRRSFSPRPAHDLPR